MIDKENKEMLILAGLKPQPFFKLRRKLNSIGNYFADIQFTVLLSIVLLLSFVVPHRMWQTLVWLMIYRRMEKC